MLTRRRSFALCAAAALSLLVAGCGGGGPPPPGSVDLTVTATPDINPDQAGRGSPVVLRVYQLAEPTSFQAADFFQLFDKEQATLGADLVAREEVVLPPGGTLSISIALKPNAKRIAIAAAFRDIDKASWRAVVEVPPTEKTKLKAEVTKLQVTLAKS
jgi:type VI secretion system protein VasD